MYISASQTVSPSTPSTYIIDTANVVLTIADGTYPSCEVSVLAQAACQVTYTGEGGATKTDTLTAGDMASYVWMDTYWKYQSVPVTGIDDNLQPFAYNIDSMVEAGGVINLTGTDANGNPFDYGLGKLVVAADEDNIVTGQEIKTSKTFNGKPVYEMVFVTTEFTVTGTNVKIHTSGGTTISNVAEVIALDACFKVNFNGGSTRTLPVGSTIVTDAATPLINICSAIMFNHDTGWLFGSVTG